MTKTNKYLIVGYRKYDEAKTMWHGVVESRNAAQAIRFYYEENVATCVLISMECYEEWAQMNGKDKLTRLERVWKENTYTDGEERVDAMKHLWSLVCGEITLDERMETPIEEVEELIGGPVVATEIGVKMERIDQVIVERANGQVQYWIQFNGIVGGYIAAVNMYRPDGQPLTAEKIAAEAAARLAAEAASYNQDLELFERHAEAFKNEMFNYLTAAKDETKITEVWRVTA